MTEKEFRKKHREMRKGLARVYHYRHHSGPLLMNNTPKDEWTRMMLLLKEISDEFSGKVNGKMPKEIPHEKVKIILSEATKIYEDVQKLEMLKKK